MKTVIIIQARMTSTRLPGKVLRPILGVPLLIRQLERVKRIQGIDQIVVATTDSADCNPVIETLQQQVEGICTFRGSEEDVLDRYYQAAKFYEADIVVRITSDCPLIDPDISSEIVSQFSKQQPKHDYISNGRIRTYPRGFDTEVFSFKTLELTHQKAQQPYEREHVTPFIWQNPEYFICLDWTQKKDDSQLRLTVDTPEDLEFIQNIFQELYPENPFFGYKDILKLLAQKPELKEINKKIKQKKIV